MFFEKLVSAASAELAETQSADDFKQPYRELLEIDGIVFPTPEVEETVRLWDAQAAIDRGTPALADDGSHIDVSGFDRESARGMLQANREPLDNHAKLNTLSELGFLSRAGSLFVARTLEYDGREVAVNGARNITDGYKNFVQVSMATTMWEQPWQDLVANGFEGSSITFPLDLKGIRRGLEVLHHELFTNIAALHFADIAYLRHNLFNQLSNSEECVGANGNQLRTLTQIGTLYGHSPEGCAEMVRKLVESERLPNEGIEWIAALRHAWDRIRD